MNPLEAYPAARKVLYIVQWLANLVMGVLGIVFLNDSNDGVPQAFTVTGLVLAFVWTYTGLTASANTPDPETPARNERGAGDLRFMLLILAVVGIGLLLLGVKFG